MFTAIFGFVMGVLLGVTLVALVVLLPVTGVTDLKLRSVLGIIFSLIGVLTGDSTPRLGTLRVAPD